ncbi:tyrosyl-DNA phosphodiesterase 2 [Olea europaea subsp. europaea]|nr:tyrosyl-DNA phosphodiesterase 2 [Olea europaea subsp. europaea]
MALLTSFRIITRPGFLFFHLPRNNSATVNPPRKTPRLITMSWTCSKCTFINPPFQKSSCQICLSAQPPQSSSPAKPKWACKDCTFLNPYQSTSCEICGARASASLLSILEVDDDDIHEAQLGSGSSIGSIFYPLKSCNNTKRENQGNRDLTNGGGDLDDASRGFKGGLLDLQPSNNKKENMESPNVCTGDGSAACSSRGLKGSFPPLRPCGNKRKNREDADMGGDGGAGDSIEFRAVKAGNKAVEVESLGAAVSDTHLGTKPKTTKILSYNVWFREDLEVQKRMKSLGDLIQLHLPNVICFQEVTPNIYKIFQQSSWWKDYHCSVSSEVAFSGPYFCMQLSNLPIKCYSSKPFNNTIMGRELCIAEGEAQTGAELVVATSHLESPCPGPPTWDQMFSKERVDQAKEAVKLLDKNQNVIFCGDMNWDDKLDGQFPLSDGWIDAWTELRPGEVGWTYDTKSNKMLSGNRTLQKRLDRFVCKLRDFKISEIEMIGMDAIPGLSYMKEKKVKKQVQNMVLPVLPSDHYGLLLTICSNKTT